MLSPLRAALLALPVALGALGVAGAECWLATPGAPRHPGEDDLDPWEWGAEATVDRLQAAAVTEAYKASIRRLLDRWALAVAANGWADLDAPRMMVCWAAVLAKTVAPSTIVTYLKTVSSFVWRASRIWAVTGWGMVVDFVKGLGQLGGFGASAPPLLSQ